MTDGHDDDDERTTPEGVRILGAEEARAAVEGGRARPADADPPPRRARRPERPERPEPRWAPPEATTSDDLAGLDSLGAASAPPRFPDDGPTWSGAPDPLVVDDDELEIIDEGLDAYVVDDEPRVSTGEVPALPHWTEPPTGAVPAIFAGDEATPAAADPDDLDAWAALGGSRRFRAEGSDWADADFGARDLGDDELQVGALGRPTAPPDDDDTFDQDVAARRRPRRSAPQEDAGTPRPTRRPRPAPAPPAASADEEMFGDAGGRDLPTALATAAIMVVLALVCFSWGRGATAWLAAAVAGGSALELSWELRRRGLRPATPLVLLGSVGIVVSAYQYGTPAYPVFTALVVGFAMVWFLWRVTPGRPTAGMAATVLSFAWIGGLAGFAGLMLQARDGVGILLGTAICVIASDVAGFFVGSQFGKSPIAPSVSPNKTVEGTVASMFASLVAGWLVVGMIAPWDGSSGLALGALVAVGALLGDLSESMIKRDLGVKDFGSLLPGHGGVLDRFDSLLFCLPIAYFLALHLDFL